MGCNRHLTRQLRTGELVDRWQVLVKQVDALPGDKVAIGKDVFAVPEGCCYVLRQSGGFNRFAVLGNRLCRWMGLKRN